MEAGSGGPIWYLDPLDGTRAYAAGQDTCAVATTLTQDGLPLLTAVAAPFSGEIYTAIRGHPSRVNNRPIRVRAPRPLTEAEFLLYYDAGDPGLSAIFGAAVEGQLGRLTMLPGSFILNACRSARGSYDVYLAVKRRSSPLMIWDLAPAALVLAGAGGELRDLEGRSLGGMIPAREVISGSPETVAAACRLLGTRIREPHPPLRWARRNEPVFARLCGMVVGRPACRMIGIAGAGGGIGKTSLAKELAALLGAEACRVVQLDDYLLPRLERDALGVGAHDPAASDLARAAVDLARLRAGSSCTKPVYDHSSGRPGSTERVTPANIIIVEGVQALHPLIRPHIDLGIFLDASTAARYRRVARDMEEKGVTEAYARRVHERLEEECRRHLLPLREAADVILAVDDSFKLEWIAPE